jgi:HK97 family phage prohead protease
MSNLISLDKFKKAGAKLSEGIDGIMKEFNVEVKDADDKKRQLLFTISTDSIDRSGDKIDQSGWYLDNYRKNPVVLLFHDYSNFPVAKSEKIWPEGGTLKSLIEFVPFDNKAVGRTAQGTYELYRDGFMSASSVGFLPTKWAYTEDTERKYGIDFMEQELLEFSLVPVPANPGALIEARSAKIDIEPIMEWARKLLMPSEIKDIRNYENFLRESGFSRNDAVLLASRGWTGLSQRDSVIAECVKVCQQSRESFK